MGVGGVGGSRGGRFDELQQQPGETQKAKGGQAAEKASLPRSGWQDQEALGAAVDRARVKLAAERKTTNPRAQLASGKRADTRRLEGPGVAHPGLVKKLGGGAGVAKPQAGVVRESPLIVAKYGVPFPGGTGGIGSQTGPVITPKYGVPRPGGSGSPDPVIVAKYGVPFPGGTGGTGPVITPKYGVPRPGGGGTPDPVIVAKYGVPFPGGTGGVGPVITPKYGVPRPGGGGTPDPVIVAKYGVPFPGGTGGTGGVGPVITPKYGVPRPGGDPPSPVITPKYGVPVRPPVDTAGSTCPTSTKRK